MMISPLSVILAPARSQSLLRTRSGRPDSRELNLSCTAVEVLLTFCPPGPPLFMNFSSRASSGMKNIFTYFNKMLPAAVLAAAVFFRSAAPGAAQQLGQVLGASGIWRTGGDILQELSWHDDSAYSYWYPCGGQLCAGARSGGRAWPRRSGPIKMG